MSWLCDNYCKFIWKYGGENVILVCQQDNWQPHTMRKRPNGYHSYVMKMGFGSCEYKFIVDDEWCHHQSSKIIDNVYGTKNNIIRYPEDINKYESFRTASTEDVWGGENVILVCNKIIGNIIQ